MNTQIARAFVVHRLDDSGLQRLHRFELRIGYCLPPAAIHENFNTKPWGDVPEETQNYVGRPVMAIYERVRGQNFARASAGANITEMGITHEVDLEIRRQGIDFEHKAGNPGSLRERLMGGKKMAAAGRDD